MDIRHADEQIFSEAWLRCPTCSLVTACPKGFRKQQPHKLFKYMRVSDTGCKTWHTTENADQLHHCILHRACLCTPSLHPPVIVSLVRAAVFRASRPHCTLGCGSGLLCGSSFALWPRRAGGKLSKASSPASFMDNGLRTSAPNASPRSWKLSRWRCSPLQPCHRLSSPGKVQPSTSYSEADIRPHAFMAQSEKAIKIRTVAHGTEPHLRH